MSVDQIHGHAVPLSIIYSKVYEGEYHDVKMSEFHQGLNSKLTLDHQDPFEFMRTSFKVPGLVDPR